MINYNNVYNNKKHKKLDIIKSNLNKQFRFFQLNQIDHVNFLKNALLNINIHFNFVLVIDMQISSTGGTSFFYNCINDYYSKICKKNIIKIKCDKNALYIYLNEIKLNLGTSFEHVQKFISLVLDKFEFIFINSFVGYSFNFIKYILNLPKQKLIITHDYSIFFKNLHPSFDELNNIEPDNINLFMSEIIEKVEYIYTQNAMNIEILSNTDLSNEIKNKLIKKSVVFDMPDYYDNYENDTKNFDNKHVDDKLVVGIVGGISSIKGLKLILDLTKKYSNREGREGREGLNIDFFNFGYNCINIPHQKYEDINEFNILLKKVQPNILIFTALVPETYSYTLTLSLLTELPIFIFDIGKCVVQERIEKWPRNKNIYYFTNLNEFDFYLSAYKNKKERIKSKLIKDEIKISNDFDFIFNDTFLSSNILEYENVVLVTSKIITSNISYNYASRSKYSSNERYIQTIDTFESIKNKIPNCFIIFIDDSDLEKEKKDKINSYVNLYVSDKNQIMRWNCDHNEFKFYGELYQTFFALNVFQNCNVKFKNFFKISGRYKLNDNFDYSLFNNEFNIFKKNNNVKNRLYYYTSLYKISFHEFDNYFNVIKKLYKDCMYYEKNIDYENLLPMQLEFSCIETIGLTQYISCDINEADEI